MEEVFKDYLEQAKVGPKKSYRNLTVLPFLVITVFLADRQA